MDRDEGKRMKYRNKMKEAIARRPRGKMRRLIEIIRNTSGKSLSFYNIDLIAKEAYRLGLYNEFFDGVGR